METRDKTGIRQWKQGVNIPRLLALVFGIIGLVFFILGGTLFLEDARFRQNAVETMATVVSGGQYTDGGSNGTYVEYMADGRLIQSRMSESSSDYSVGSTIKVYYSKDDPTIVRGDVNRVIGIVFGGVGAAFLVVAAILLIAGASRANANKRLLEDGYKVYAPITGIERNTAVRINSRNPYNIICQWTDGATGRQHVFKSGYLLDDPAYYLGSRSISDMPVYIDRNNPGRYHMDLSELEG